MSETKTYIRPDWNEYFLDIAKAVGRRATCLRRRYGAVIVKDNVIISAGYNGSPRGEVNCIDSGVCERERLKVPKGERYELCVAVHAEQNAIINADPVKMEGSTIYIAGINAADGSIASGEPCKLCRRMIQNAKIANVVFQTASGELKCLKPSEIKN
ncbi:MAG: dCMP deaminase family protein [Selenomonadaceae bacterium]|nr:dCMP deaminase family protein [Selenomonadaceae bacterium]